MSPYAGIGSEGYQAIKLGRKFIGIELNPPYYKVAAKNLASAENEMLSGTLFGRVEAAG